VPKPTQIKRRLPITVGERYEHIMTDVTITATDNTTRIEIFVEGPQAQTVANFAAQGELVTLSFPANKREGGAPSS
jgi:ribosomal protein L6P/L9E